MTFRSPLVRVVAVSLLLSVSGQRLGASENVPHAPFAQWANVPDPHQWIVGAVYQESESYHIWANGGKRYNIDYQNNGEHYGIDITQGYFTVQYGINEQWALDAAVGAATTGWRMFSVNGSTSGSIQSTTGLMDYSFGVRYQIFNENASNSVTWLPTLTFRAGAVLPGTYNQNFAFAPGNRSAAIEPEFLARKHFGWTGFGAYSDALYRWNRTIGNDQYIFSVGFIQQIKGWELNAGYRRMQTLSGEQLVYDPTTHALSTSGSDPFAFSEVREINDSIEAGFSYTTSKSHLRYSFYTRTVINGNNSDQKFWIGGGIEIPFGGKKKE